MPKDTRGKVTLTPEAYKALEVESMLMGVSLKDAASKMILKSACPKCKEILGIMARPPKGQKEEETKGAEAQGLNGPIAQETKAQAEVIETKGQMTQVPDVPKAQRQKKTIDPKAKRPKLSESPMALKRIKELWEVTPRPLIREIAIEIGYPKATVADNIRKMKERGELQ